MILRNIATLLFQDRIKGYDGGFSVILPKMEYYAFLKVHQNCFSFNYNISLGVDPNKNECEIIDSWDILPLKLTDYISNYYINIALENYEIVSKNGYYLLVAITDNLKKLYFKLYLDAMEKYNFELIDGVNKIDFTSFFNSNTIENELFHGAHNLPSANRYKWLLKKCESAKFFVDYKEVTKIIQIKHYNEN